MYYSQGVTFFCRQEATKSLDITEATKLPPEALDKAITLEVDFGIIFFSVHQFIFANSHQGIIYIGFNFNLYACLDVDAKKYAELGQQCRTR